MKTLIAVIKRPAFWTFLAAAVAFGSVYFVEGYIEPGLLIAAIEALIALIGIGAVAKASYDVYQEKKNA